MTLLHFYASNCQDEVENFWIQGSRLFSILSEFTYYGKFWLTIAKSHWGCKHFY